MRSDRLRRQLRWYRKHNSKFKGADPVDSSWTGVQTAVVIDRSVAIEDAVSRDASGLSIDAEVASVLDAATERFNAPVPVMKML